MTDTYGRDFAAWKADGFAMDYVDMPAGTIIIAGDQVGDFVVVLTPTGDAYGLTSDGDKIHMLVTIDGKTGWQHLYEGLQSGILHLAGA